MVKKRRHTPSFFNAPQVQFMAKPIHDEINSCRKAIHSCPHAAIYLGSLERGAGFCEAKD